MIQACTRLFIVWCCCAGHAHAQCCKCGQYGAELVINGDFSQGNTGFSSAYQFATNASPGRYGITTNASLANPGSWGSCTDHTTASGNFLWADLSTSSSINIWTQQVSNVQPNNTYLFSCWVNTLDPGGPGTLQFSINGLLAGTTFTAPAALCNWVKFCVRWNSGNSSNATISITNQSQFAAGNDVGIDDISFRECTGQPEYGTTDTTVCSNDMPFVWHNQFYYTPGLYTKVLTGADGCDSVVKLQLAVDSAKRTVTDSTACKFPFWWNGIQVITPGVYNVTLKARNRCDSVVQLRVTAPGDAFVEIDTVVCSNAMPFSWGGKWYYTAGVYRDTFFRPRPEICDSFVTVKLTLRQQKLPTLDKFLQICPQGTRLLNPGQFDSYLWQDSSTASQYTVRRPGNYWVIVKDKCGISRADVQVEQVVCNMAIPNAFTPNGDGLNDILRVLHAADKKEFEFAVYNRWGAMVFFTANSSVGWDGKYKDAPQNRGVYVWRCSYTDGTTKERVVLKGNVLLIR